jgi:hypothetical protein
MQIIYKRYILWALFGLYMLAAGVQSYACVMNTLLYTLNFQIIFAISKAYVRNCPHPMRKSHSPL